MKVKRDFILNGHAVGNVAANLMQHDFNVNTLRPFIGNDGRSYLSVIGNDGKLSSVPVANANATLRHEDWLSIDAAVRKAAKPRLKAVGDLVNAGLTYRVPNGMGKTVLAYEKQSDINDASISMDGLREGENDRPEYEITNLPLPIIHKDFQFSARQLSTSRNSNTPLDTTMAELAARKVAEEAEKLLLGELDTYTYGGGTIYGYTNFPSRLTKTFTSPTAGGWTASTFVDEILDARQQLRGAYHYGPYMLYVNSAWDAYLDDDFKAASDITLRERVMKIDGISGIKTLDYLSTDYDLVLLQMTPDVAREVIGMDMTTVQWETDGGMLIHFKVMTIMVPQMRDDINDNTGVLHGSV